MMSKLSNLKEHEAQIFSQCGEDGVLQRIFEVIGTTHRHFVEFGAWDGCFLSNTANLRINHGWTGLLMEGSDSADEVLVQREFVQAENVNQLFAKYAVPKDFDLLSIDIDGNDYWVWKALTDFQPRVVVMEYNIFFDLDSPQTIEYNPDHIWDESTYHGASLAALRKLGKQKGYSLVYTDSWAPNAFFILDSELPSGYTELPIEEVTLWRGMKENVDAMTRPWVTV